MKLRSLYRREPNPVLPTFVEAGEHQVPLTFRENARAKRLILRIAPDGGAVVTVPPRTSGKTLTDFVDRHRGWIAERAGGRRTPLLIENGAIIPVRGERVRLSCLGGRRVPRLDAEAGELSIGGLPEHFPRRVADYLKKEARTDLTAAVARHAETVGLQPKALTLKDTVSRWGSCTMDRRLSFSWRIVMAPPRVLDYLAAHEVAHFVEMNHSPAFWAVCRSLCPDMDEGRAWLKANGASLHRIRF
ncbi:SprT family zinc-dependent metalloprotease [Fulvimarina sp. 2208YS6-2-32]|uniref:SprT family zinc-dependent metalloprotease n=1 Tax=Fulvimarina uroteuthidis TaxID=3098149 RepID=A0ABU5I278_9HYPH|nr:SprT family zinc-dependent metalloprotease [Fulvimarina sp. 2208YS6-2-32]MDY8109083.1 SprT family zinc-dependent metalloprotease [Fulvimarina sp. 2208YS6-2-32]